MKNNAIKNRTMFLGEAIVSATAVFVFSLVFFGAPQAHAYAVGSVSTDMSTSSYDFGNSLQNLISPFTSFIDSLKFNTPIDISGGTSAGSITNDVTSAVAAQGQNYLSQWLSQFNDWVYAKTGVQLSGIFYVFLNAVSWVLGLAQQVVNWLLGLFQ